jgi:hypothetical protein
MKQIRIVALLLATVFLTSGCASRIFKETFGAYTGPKGVYAQVDRVRTLEGYGTFEVGTFSNDSGGRTPAEFFTMLPGYIRTKLVADEKMPLTGMGGKTAVISGEVIYYEKAGAMGQLFGPFEEAIMEVTLTDKATGAKLGRATCIGRSTESVNQGVEKKAEGAAKAIVEWIKDVKLGKAK